MTTATKSKAEKPDLHIVGPDIAEMERLVVDAAALQAPIVSRATQHLDRLTIAQRELVNERENYVDRRTLLDRQYQAACVGLDSEIADIDAALALYASAVNAAA